MKVYTFLKFINENLNNEFNTLIKSDDNYIILSDILNYIPEELKMEFMYRYTDNENLTDILSDFKNKITDSNFNRKADIILRKELKNPFEYSEEDENVVSDTIDLFLFDKQIFEKEWKSFLDNNVIKDTLLKALSYYNYESKMRKVNDKIDPSIKNKIEVINNIIDFIENF